MPHIFPNRFKLCLFWTDFCFWIYLVYENLFFCEDLVLLHWVIQDLRHCFQSKITTILVDYSILFLKTWRFFFTKKVSSELLKNLQPVISKLKNWYYSYWNTPFISLSITVTMRPCTVEFYLQKSQSKSFNGNALLLLFHWDWSRLMNNQKLLNSYTQVNDQTLLIVWHF